MRVECVVRYSYEVHRNYRRTPPNRVHALRSRREFPKGELSQSPP